MKKILNFGICFMVAICGICMISGAYAKTTRDQTLDYLCRPRWDKFIVDEKTTLWDRDSLACYDKAGREVDVFKMYGTQSLYGEFDESGNVVLKVQNQDAGRLYGDPNGINARNLYGEPTNAGHVVVAKPKPAPIRAAAPIAVKNNPKQPVVTPKPAAKKPVSKPAPAPIKPVKPTAEKMQVVWVEPIEDTMPTPKPQPKPTPVKPVKATEPARNIAHTLNTAVDVDSYCTEINPAVKGPMPKGLILMSGRPDQMSCVKNK